jgi:hypothetical protein
MLQANRHEHDPEKWIAVFRKIMLHQTVKEQEDPDGRRHAEIET